MAEMNHPIDNPSINTWNLSAPCDWDLRDPQVEGEGPRLLGSGAPRKLSSLCPGSKGEFRGHCSCLRSRMLGGGPNGAWPGSSTFPHHPVTFTEADQDPELKPRGVQ